MGEGVGKFLSRDAISDSIGGAGVAQKDVQGKDTGRNSLAQEERNISVEAIVNVVVESGRLAGTVWV